ncbi:MAG: septum formation initiator family protein [Gammaproteobacteria bacterium]
MRWLILVALVICFVLLQRGLWSGESGLPGGWRLDAQIAKRQQENAQLKRENDKRWEEVKALRQGGAAIEEHARTDLGWVKRGETFYQIVHVPPAASAIVPVTAVAPASGG